MISTQPAASPVSAWQAGFDSINANKINVLYVTKEAATPELLAYLATLDVAMIGNQTPPAEGKPKWVATIYSDGITPIRDIWEDLMAGKGGKVVNAALKITDNQYVTVGDGLVWLSQGKLDYAQKTMDLLQENLSILCRLIRSIFVLLPGCIDIFLKNTKALVIAILFFSFPMNSSMVARPGCDIPSPDSIFQTVMRKMRISSQKDQWSTYQTSSLNFSSQVMALRPLICAQPVMPGSTSWRRACSGE